MRKAELVDNIARRTGITRIEVATVIDSFIAEIREAIANGNEVELRGLGTFTLREKKARIGKNPRTGETIHVPEKKVPAFRISLDWKKSLSKNTK
ncbi:MAG: integration host factor subunit beta [bacterium]|nr:integration host factor subunit beta [bacterium]